MFTGDPSSSFVPFYFSVSVLDLDNWKKGTLLNPKPLLLRGHWDPGSMKDFLNRDLTGCKKAVSSRNEALNSHL